MYLYSRKLSGSFNAKLFSSGEKSLFCKATIFRRTSLISWWEKLKFQLLPTQIGGLYQCSSCTACKKNSIHLLLQASQQRALTEAGVNKEAGCPTSLLTWSSTPCKTSLCAGQKIGQIIQKLSDVEKLKRHKNSSTNLVSQKSPF